MTIEEIIENDKARLKNIEVGTQHRLLRDQWLDNKRILDKICKQLSSFSDEEHPVEFERVRELLGGKDKPKPKTHNFAFTGIIRCGVCGCLITAEEKKKFIKSKKAYATYVYYRCTKRKREMNCKEPSIKLDELEKQIVGEIEKYTIPEEFKNWALEVIREENKKEINDRSKIYDMLNKKYLGLQKQLDNLTKMRLKEMINDEEFTKERNELNEQIVSVREKMNQNQNRGQSWITLAEKAFNFAVHARDRFINAKNIDTKRKILSALGQSYILRDRKLCIEPMEWLVPISNVGKIDEKSGVGLEPTKNWLSSQRNQSLVHQNLYRGA